MGGVTKEKTSVKESLLRRDSRESTMKQTQSCFRLEIAGKGRELSSLISNISLITFLLAFMLSYLLLQASNTSICCMLVR